MPKSSVLKFVKEVQHFSPSALRKYFFPRYQYHFAPQHLVTLSEFLQKSLEIEGEIAEIGCAEGHTTLFLNKFLDFAKAEKQYFAIDTFSGFTESDIQYEVEERNNHSTFEGFSVNKKAWFNQTLSANKVERVQTIQADVNQFDFSNLPQLAFSLVDVDLYKPMKRALEEVYKITTPKGYIVADDCRQENTRWDGAYYAYMEFVEEQGLKPDIRYGKLGIIQKSE